jgi:hypothetical protein
MEMREITTEERERITKIVDVNTMVALAMLLQREVDKNKEFYKYQQKNAFTRMNKNIDILFSMSGMTKEDIDYTNSLVDSFDEGFLLEFKRQYRKEVENQIFNNSGNE